MRAWFPRQPVQLQSIRVRTGFALGTEPIPQEESRHEKGCLDQSGPGIWLIAAPFALGDGGTSQMPLANDVTLGVLLVASSSWKLAASAPP